MDTLTGAITRSRAERIRQRDLARIRAAEPEKGAKHELLTLPGEIRNHIYRAAVVWCDPVPIRIIYSGRTATQHLWSASSHEPSLLLASKDVRNEALSIYYAEATFDLVLYCGYYKENIRAWFRSLGSRAGCISHLRLTLRYSTRSPTLAWAGQVKSETEHFTVQLDRSQHGAIVAQLRSVEKNAPYCSCGIDTIAATLESKSGTTELTALALALTDDRWRKMTVKPCLRCRLPKLTQFEEGDW